MNRLSLSRVLRWASARLNVSAPAVTPIPHLWPVLGLSRPLHCQCGFVTARPTPCTCGTRFAAACRRHQSGHLKPFEVGLGLAPNVRWLDGFDLPHEAVAQALRYARGHYGPQQTCGGWCS